MPITKPKPGEYAPYYETYIGEITTNDLIENLKSTGESSITFLRSIPTEKHLYKYAEGKWSIQELLLHIIDAERIFAYRALRFARNDNTELAGFDEQKYTPESNADARTMASLVEEFQKVREASIALFASFTEDVALRRGKANGHDVSVRALGFIIAGHAEHHLQVIRNRYL